MRQIALLTVLTIGEAKGKLFATAAQLVEKCIRKRKGNGSCSRERTGVWFKARFTKDQE